MAKSKICKLCLAKPSLSNNLFFKNLAVIFILLLILLFIVGLFWSFSRIIFKKIFVDNIENFQNNSNKSNPNYQLSNRQLTKNDKEILRKIKELEEAKLNEQNMKKYEYTTDDLDLNLKGQQEPPTLNGIPSSNALEIDMKKGWSVADKEAAQIPEYYVCNTSILDGKRFCGIPASNSYTVFDFKT
jgi:hypothetical protein